MKIQLIVILALSLCVTSRDSNDEDEGRPYEFGFTIDGQQHRRESKDVNGIIMGEFGFITADGIYHVTVYATDENGSFKILSMRNVRVSGPLDQPGYEFPSKTAVQQPQAPTTTTTTTTTVAPTTNNAPYIFTTLPSLKVPSCSSCRLPSTTPRPPGASNKLQFQTPEFQENKPGIPNKAPQRQNAPFSTPNNKQPVVPQNLAPHNNLGIPNVGPPNVDPQNNVGPPNVATQNNVRPSNFAPQNNVSPQNNVPFSNQNAPENSRKNVEENLDKFGVGIFEPRFEPKPVKPSIEQQPPFQNPGNNAIDITNHNPISPTHESLQNPAPNIAARIPDQFPQTTNQNFPPKSPEITVANHQINIPGKEPIPIKDSYPNMIDGLPNGITENDMLDLLYKFNYTLGFHGHHERGLKNGAKIGAYFVNGRDGIMRVVEYIADENGYRPKVKFINLGLDSPDTPKEGTEKTFGLKGFEFVWYPV